MTSPEHAPTTGTSTTEWPYHSDTHDLILKEMAAHGREVPPSYHEQQREAERASTERHERAVAYSAGSYDTEALELQFAQAKEAVKNLTRELLAKHQALNIARDALALKLSREAAAVADNCIEPDFAL